MSELLTQAQLKTLFPKRDIEANKGDFGSIALIGGSVNYSGSIRLAEMANTSMRCGVGKCCVATPKSVAKIVAPDILESTIYSLSEFDGGVLFKETEFSELMKSNEVIAFGMGLGRSPEIRHALEFLLREYEGILLVDADGINAMAEMDVDTIAAHKCKLIVTPHPKEFANLTDTTVEDVLADPETKAKNLARDINAVVLLKGHTTYICTTENAYRVTAGGPGMATAGSGDVLSGIAAAILVNNQENPLLATAGAAYINAIAGEIAEAENGEIGQIASDTARCVQATINQIVGFKPVAIGVKGSFLLKRSLLKLVVALLIIAAASAAALYVVPKFIKQTEISEYIDQDDYIATMEFVKKDIYIDGILVNNYELYRPFTRMNSRIYVPLTEDVCSALGIKASWEGVHPRDIYIETIEASKKGAFYDKHGWNLADVTGWAKGNVTVHIKLGDYEETLHPDVSEVVSYNDGEVLYLPISLLSKSDACNISAYYDDLTGLYLSSDKDIPAEKYLSKENAAFITARAEYINSYLKEFTLGDCAAYEYLFRHESTLRDLDEDLLISIARTESQFDRYSVSKKGALGMMQFMPNTAKNNGVPLEDLFDPHKSIEFGARYFSDAIVNFKGDVTKALAAYNHGAGAVLAGDYDLAYADTILNRMANMRAGFEAKGYSNEFLTKIECTK